MHRIVLLDDHAIVREGFKRLLEGSREFTVVAEAATIAEALLAIRQHRPDAVVLDLGLGAGAGGLELLRWPELGALGCRRVVLSMHDDPALVLRAMDLGAHAFVTKATAPDELLAILRKVMLGETVLSSDLAPHGLVQSRPNLTPRERETLRHLLSNLPPKAVAVELGISDKTLYRHRANLMEKLGARTLADLSRIARERGLLLDRD